MKRELSCPVCDGDSFDLDRRHFLKAAGAAAVAAALPNVIRAAESDKPTPETLVKKLYETLSDSQKKVVAFAWDHNDEKLGLLRTRVSNNWHITQPKFAASSTRRTSRRSAARSTKASFSRNGSSTSTSSFRTTTAARPGARPRTWPSSAGRAMTSSS